MNTRRTGSAIALLVMVVFAAANAAGATAPATNGQIAFVRIVPNFGPSGPLGEIIVANADGSGEHSVSGGDLPDWSPDGSRIVFQSCGSRGAGGPCGIASASPDGGNPKALSPLCPAGPRHPFCFDDRSPAYSPNGRQIAFIRTKTRPMLMLASSSTLAGARPIAGVSASSGSPYAAAWSPNGKQLAFASVNDVRSRAQPESGRALYVMAIGGKGLRRVTPWSLAAGGRPDWSPDWKRILFRSASDRLGGFGANLYSIRPNGTGLTQLTDVSNSDRVLGGAYSPDGASIVYASSAGAVVSGQPSIFVMRSDGTGARPVTRSYNWEASPDWGPRR